MLKLTYLTRAVALSAAFVASGAAAGSLLNQDLRESGHVAPGADVGFNPQPEPPARINKASDILNPAGKHGFNPQPEPPPHGMTFQKTR